MWEIENYSPFPVSGGFQRDQNGKSFWCAWIACDFQLRPDRPPLFATTQTPPLISPKFAQDDPTGLLLADSETSLSKPGVDLTIAADGHPPSDAPFFPRIRWGEAWQKQLTVYPPQVWNRWGRQKRCDLPFTPVPLDWSAAVKCANNPLGVKADFGSRKAARGQPAPQLNTNSQQIQINNMPPPASFMPVPRAWPQRAKHGGTYDTAWQRKRAPLFPSDLSPRYWQVAPDDQVLDRNTVMKLIDHGTPLETVYMTADASFKTLVPDLRFDLSVYFRGAWHDVACALQSIHLDLRAMTIRQIWMAQFSIVAAHFDVALDRTHLALRSATNMAVSAADAARFSTDSIHQKVLSA